MFRMKKLVIFWVIISFLWLNIFWNISLWWNWLWSVENSWWMWSYKEKLQDLKNIFDWDWHVSAQKILKNRDDIRSMFIKKQLVWWDYIQDLITVIALNASFEINWDNINTITIWTELPVFKKSNDLWHEAIYISVDEKKVKWKIFDWKEQIWKENIFNMLWIDKELEWKWWILPSFYKNWQNWYAYVWKWFRYSLNKLFEMLESDEMKNNIIPIETSNSFIFAWLTAQEIWLKNYSQFNTSWEQFNADNPFVISWKIQIDSFLFHYCQKEYFWWDHWKTLDMFVKWNYEQCFLLENDFDNDWINELILSDEQYRVSNVYFQDKWEWWKLIIWPIFKSDRQIIKLLENSKNYYSSFLLKDWIDTNSYKNILQNNTTIKIQWWSNSFFKFVDLTQSFKWISPSSKLYSIKDLYSKNWNWYSNYKITWFYSVSHQDKFWRDNWEWWIILENNDWNFWSIYINEKYIWLATKWFKNESWNEYILLPRKQLWVSLKNSYIELDFWVKTWWKTLTLKIDWKEKLIVQEWWTEKIIFPDWEANAEIQLTWNNTSWLLSNFENITKVWLISHMNSNWNTEKQNSIYDLKFLVPDMSNIFLYWLKNDKNSSWFQLNQILTVQWYEYNFVSSNNVSDKTAKNIVLKNNFNFDDNIKNQSWKNQFIFNNERIPSWVAYAWYNLHLRNVKYFSKDSLYLEQIKNIYFDYDKVNELYVLSDNSHEDINIKWIKLWDYDFLNWCSYEEIINNDLENCSKNLTSIDVDNDWWNEWLFNNTKEIQIFNNIIKYNVNWTYSINFIPIFKDAWLTFCNTFIQKIPYYKKWTWNLCEWNWSWWICETNFGLIFYDNIWMYKTFVIQWENKDKKSYSISETSMWQDFICIS